MRKTVFFLLVIALLLAACGPGQPPASAPIIGSPGIAEYRGLPVSPTTSLGKTGVGIEETYNGYSIWWREVANNTKSGGAIVYEADGLGIFKRVIPTADHFARERNAAMIEAQVKGWASGKTFIFDETAQTIYSRSLGTTLMDIVKREGGWTPKTLGYYAQLEELATRLYDAGVEVKDLGPYNCLVNEATGEVSIADLEFNKFRGEFGYVEDEIEAAMLRRSEFANRFAYQTADALQEVPAMTYDEYIANAGVDTATVESLLAKTKGAPVNIGVSASEDLWIFQMETGGTYQVRVPKGTTVTEAAVAAEFELIGLRVPVFWIRSARYVAATFEAAAVIIVVWDASNWAYQNIGFTGLLAPRDNEESWSVWPGSAEALVASGYEGWIPFRLYHGPSMDHIFKLMETSVMFAVSDPTMTRILKDDTQMDLWVNSGAFDNVDTGIKISPFEPSGAGTPWPWAKERTGLRWWDANGAIIDVIYDANTQQWNIVSPTTTISHPFPITLKDGSVLQCTLTLTMKTDAEGPYEEYVTTCP